MLDYNVEVITQTEELSDWYVYCRCHTSNNTCYGGNAISFRPLCNPTGGINVICSDTELFKCP